MANSRQSGKVRKDKKGRTLLKGEYQYTNGRYEYTYTDVNGNKDKVYSWCLTETDKPPKGKTCDKCLRILEAEIRRDIANGIDSKKARNYTLDALFDEHMQNCNDLKKSTKDHFLYTYNKYIHPVLGNRKVTTLKHSTLRNFYADLLQKSGLKISTLEIIHSLIRKVLQDAVKDDILLKNPCDGIMSEFKTDTTKRKALEEDEQAALINFVSSTKKYRRWLFFLTMALGTGMRIGELLGLCWDDCDFDNEIIHVRHNLLYRRDYASGKYEFHVTTPKSKAGIRVIPMLPEVKRALQEERLRQMSKGFNHCVIDGVSGFVFTNNRGNVYVPHTINSALERIRKAYNEQEEQAAEQEHREPILIPYFTCHVLRHTFCTRYCENETNLKVIQEIMGHSKISTTMDIYNDATMKKKKESFASLEGKIKIG